MGTPAREATSSQVKESNPTSTSTLRAEDSSVWNLRRLRSWIGRRRGTRMSGSSVVPAGSGEAAGPPGGPAAAAVLGPSAPPALGELHAEQLGDHGDVPLGADVGAGQRQGAVRLHHEGRADHSHDGLAVVLLLAERPP